MGVGLHLCNSARGGGAHALREDSIRKTLAENTESKVDGLESADASALPPLVLLHASHTTPGSVQ